MSGGAAALVGLGGVGKTQVALAYMARHAGDYAKTFWLPAEEASTLASHYAALAKSLQLFKPNVRDQARAVEAVREWLRVNPGWLLVFDNARQPADVQMYLPDPLSGHVLITSRYPTWRSLAEPLSVETLASADAVSFLLRRTGQADANAALELAFVLGYLPLALEQAGAYMEAKQRSFAEYLDLFIEQRSRLLLRGPSSTNYRATVATTWEVSFQQVEAASAAACDLLHLCAFLAPDRIPIYAIADGVKQLPSHLASTFADTLALDDAVGELLQFSLVAVQGQNISIHRLVQAVLRDRLDDRQARAWADTAVHLVNAEFPSGADEVQTWAVCARWLPHALETLRRAQSSGVAARPAFELLNKLGEYWSGHAQFSEARPAFAKSIEVAEQALGPANAGLVPLLQNLGQLLVWVGSDLELAKTHLQRALRIHRETSPAGDALEASMVNSLGGALRIQGDLDGACALYRRALELDEAAYGPDDPRVAIRLNNLGRVLGLLDQHDQARAYLERALKIDENASGGLHPNVGIDLRNLGRIMQGQGDLSGARKCLERSLRIIQNAYAEAVGGNHPQVAETHSALADLLVEHGDLLAARQHFDQALKIDAHVFGPGANPSLARDMHGLGRLLRVQGDLVTARTTLVRALDVMVAVHGPNHADVAAVAFDLGGVLEQQGDLQAAAVAFERAWQVASTAYGKDHPIARKFARRSGA
jgi:tetratricopeptide (TPR) repeat protein